MRLLDKKKTFVDAYGEDFTTTVIEINIAKNGTYIIKGSNEINGAFVDTHIKVEKGVEANIIFDGAQIQNNQMYDSGVDSCGNIYTNQLFSGTGHRRNSKSVCGRGFLSYIAG